MGGLHIIDLVIILGIGLAIFGPKALQSMARSAGRGVSQAKTAKDRVLSELPVEEISKISRQIPRVPLSPQQAVQMLMAPPEKEQQPKTPTQPEAANTANTTNPANAPATGERKE